MKAKLELFAKVVFCECGCGEKIKVLRWNYRCNQPTRFAVGHGTFKEFKGFPVKDKSNSRWKVRTRDKQYIHWSRIVYENKIFNETGAYKELSINEIVHHIDENVSNDKIENLELKTSSNHAIGHFTGKKYRLGKKQSETTKHKLSIANTGRHPSLETRMKMTNSQRGRKHSPETRDKMSKSSVGKHHLTDESKKRISSAQKGNKSCVGRQLSKETKQKISFAQKQYWDKKREITYAD